MKKSDTQIIVKQHHIEINQLNSKILNSNEFTKVLNLYVSIEKWLIKNDNSSASENLVIGTIASSSLLYAHNRKYNSIVKKYVSEIMAKKDQGCPCKERWSYIIGK